METVVMLDMGDVIRRIGKVGIIFVVAYHLPRTTFASTSQLKEGNRQFKNGHYEEALKLYEDALIDTPYSSILHFNAGDATMMMGDFPKAEVSYMEAAKSANPLLRGASHYNRGNSLFYQGKWQEAIDAYKDSLRANPADMDAKYNLGIALRALKNPPSPPKGGSGGQARPQQGDSKKQNDKSQGNSPAEASAKAGMSREDAERLLAAAGAGEKKKSQQKMPKGEVPHPDEDW
jgi:tetratricopeptide (TPR) repeat protein